MSQKQEEQTIASKEESTHTSTEECQKIIDVCDLIIEKIKRKKRVRTDK
jgi:hypothetical protein